MPTTLLPGSKESGSAEMGEDRGRSFAGSKEVDVAGERGEGLGGTVWGGASRRWLGRRPDRPGAEAFGKDLTPLRMAGSESEAGEGTGPGGT